MEESQAIFKIGGKILEKREDLISTISQLTSLYECGILNKVILIAGGGTYANLIRLLDSKLHIGEEISHWMAIYTMDLNGKKVSRYFPRIKKTKDVGEIERNSRIFTVFLPYKFLRQTDILPHSWNITSDSISVFLAHHLNLNTCFLIKSVDGIFDDKNQLIKDISSRDLLKLRKSGGLANYKSNKNLKGISQPVDPFLTNIMSEFKINTIILNGTALNLRILKYFKLKDTENMVYTRITYS